MAHLILTLLFLIAAAFYFYGALVNHRRGDNLKWLRLATGIGFLMMAIGFLIATHDSRGLSSLGAIVVFVTAVATALLTVRRARR